MLKAEDYVGVGGSVLTLPVSGQWDLVNRVLLMVLAASVGWVTTRALKRVFPEEE